MRRDTSSADGGLTVEMSSDLVQKALGSAILQLWMRLPLEEYQVLEIKMPNTREHLEWKSVSRQQ